MPVFERLQWAKVIKNLIMKAEYSWFVFLSSSFLSIPSSFTWSDVFSCSPHLILIPSYPSSLFLLTFPMVLTLMMISSPSSSEECCSPLISSVRACTNLVQLIVELFEDILAPRTRINLSFAALKPCCQAAYFAKTKNVKRIKFRVLGSSWSFVLASIHINLTFKHISFF